MEKDTNRKKRSNGKSIIAGLIVAVMILGTLLPIIMEVVMYS